MRIGLPREIKDGEYRVALTPAGVGALLRAGHEVVVEPGLGLGIGFSDKEFLEVKAKQGNPWDCELIVKVKELQEPEYRLPRPGQTVFSFQHFGPEPALVDVGIDQGGIAETSRPTSHSAPVYVAEGVVHYCVPNMPSAVARTASLALKRAALPFVLELCSGPFSTELKTGIQVKEGKVAHEFLARDTRRPYHPP